MIDYTLAKKLKDSGFPQNGDGIELHTPDCKGWDGPSDCTTKTRAYASTLEELIEAIDDHVKLEWFPKTQSAFANCCDRNDHQQTGSSLDEAVANLYLALHPSE